MYLYLMNRWMQMLFQHMMRQYLQMRRWWMVYILHGMKMDLLEKHGF